MFPAFDQRSRELERLDTGDYTPEEYQRWLQETKFINRWLGDARALRLFLQSELRDSNVEAVSILDVGAGSGELLNVAREIIGNKTSLLVGAELSSEAAKAIGQLPVKFNVSAVQCNALNLPFANNSFDFAISSLFLHHLDNGHAVTLIKEMDRVAKKNFLIIDLHRHRAAYYLYRIFGPIVLQQFTIDDGSLSILRSYRPDELKRLAVSSGITNPVVKRRVGFRLAMTRSTMRQTV